MTTNEDGAGVPAALQHLGFTDYEARAYVALVAGGELNGYALAKASGIPRANIYAVAGKLVQRGAAQRVERPAGAAYVAIEPRLLLRDMELQRRKAISEARQALAGLSASARPAARARVRMSLLVRFAAASGARALCRAAAFWPGRNSARSSVFIP